MADWLVAGAVPSAFSVGCLSVAFVGVVPSSGGVAVAVLVGAGAGVVCAGVSLPTLVGVAVLDESVTDG